MIFVDPYAEEGSRSNQAMRLPPDQGSDLEKLFKAWGISYARDKVMGDLGSAQRVSAGVDDLGRPIITDYVAWITMRQDRMNADDVVTGELRIVNLASTGFIEKAEGAKIEIEPLITSTKSSAPVDAQKVRFQPNPANILKEFKADEKSYVIAARVSGTLDSAFPDGQPKKKGDDKDGDADKDADKKKPAPHLAQSKTPANLIVVADSDILADAFWLQTQDFFGQQLVVPTANNADFVINALDNLSGSSALIGLRSRGLSNRPFMKLQEIQRAAEDRFRDREQALVKQLDEVQKNLKNLQTKEQTGGTAVLTTKQREAIEKFRGDMVKIRRELREVQLKLREDIDNLDAWTRVLNIGAMPVAVALIAIALALIRRQRSRRRYATALT
jgi:ABC-type uncharacterized transport system involved in gliding motility auxiliary subunit